MSVRHRAPSSRLQRSHAHLPLGINLRQKDRKPRRAVAWRPARGKIGAQEKPGSDWQLPRQGGGGARPAKTPASVRGRHASAGAGKGTELQGRTSNARWPSIRPWTVHARPGQARKCMRRCSEPLHLPIAANRRASWLAGTQPASIWRSSWQGQGCRCAKHGTRAGQQQKHQGVTALYQGML